MNFFKKNKEYIERTSYSLTVILSIVAMSLSAYLLYQFKSVDEKSADGLTKTTLLTETKVDKPSDQYNVYVSMLTSIVCIGVYSGLVLSRIFEKYFKKNNLDNLFIFFPILAAAILASLSYVPEDDSGSENIFAIASLVLISFATGFVINKFQLIKENKKFTSSFLILLSSTFFGLSVYLYFVLIKDNDKTKFEYDAESNDKLRRKLTQKEQDCYISSMSFSIFIVILTFFNLFI